ncbi:metallophosphoesterase family protein [candidate division KSB1 bacterium]|nr:metallophosphoesterase family protein [candidate division KSB1 bacterium]
MRYAILSDIHGNLEALEAVLLQIENASIDYIICLGDVVGYGPNPNECIELIKQKAKIILAGNHDYAPIGRIDTSFFNAYAKAAIRWTGEVLTEENMAFLAGLPLQYKEGEVHFVHATPHKPEQWDYIFYVDDAIQQFLSFSDRVCFVGHSHSPVIFSELKRQEYHVLNETAFCLEAGVRYIINVGSVGQPRDLNPNSAYAVYDTDTGHYHLHRTEYDIVKTQMKMRAVGLPNFLIARLQIGQ